MRIKTNAWVGAGLAAGVASLAVLAGQFSGGLGGPPSQAAVTDKAALSERDVTGTSATPFQHQPQINPISPDEARKALATALSLPLGRTVAYYNRATNTAFREACTAGEGASVKCRLDILGMTAQLDHGLETTYALDSTALITVQSTKVRAADWTDEATKLYDATKKEAQTREWAAGAPIARLAQNSRQDIIQNNIIELTAVGTDGAALCSTAPVSAERGIDVCLSFDGASQEVRSAALPRIGTAGALNELLLQPQAAIRGFNRYDHEYLERHKAQLHTDGTPSYIIRR